jgi:type I restriction enzyme S subunit
MDGDLLMVDASEDTDAIGKAVEIAALNGAEAVAGLHCIALRGDENRIVNGFRGYLQYLPSMRAAMKRLASGVSVFGISKSGVKAIELDVPSPKEQSAIAHCLRNLQSQIDAIQARIGKARKLKLGMMQELLTGRIRLV